LKLAVVEGQYTLRNSRFVSKLNISNLQNVQFKSHRKGSFVLERCIELFKLNLAGMQPSRKQVRSAGSDEVPLLIIPYYGSVIANGVKQAQEIATPACRNGLSD
jgi:hypothetical protein